MWLSLHGLVGLLVSGFALGPPTGWVDKNGKTGTGIYVLKNGMRYAGGYVENAFQGPGRLVYGKANDPVYRDLTPTPFPSQLAHAELRGEWRNDKIRTDRPATFTAPQPDALPFVYVGGWDAGTSGAGVVTFKNGRRFEGSFFTESTLYSFFNSELRVKWEVSNIIGSHFSGYGKMTWPDGTTFEGVVYKYYLFGRGNHDVDCAPSRLVGKGILKQPGQPDYEGFVAELRHGGNGQPKRVSEAEFATYVNEMTACPNILRSARSNDTLDNRRLDAEQREARKAASVMLARDLNQLSAKLTRESADIEAASRGTTVAADRAKAERDNRFYAGIAEQQADPNSQLNRDKRESERKAEANRREEAARNQAVRKPSISGTATTLAAANPAAEDKLQKQKDADEFQAQQERERKRLETEKTAKDLRDRLERDRLAADEAARKKAEKEKQPQDAARAEANYLGALESGIKLVARHCPGGEGKHYIVGHRPRIKPEVVSCVDVSYVETCDGAKRGTPGVARNFLGAGADCFFGDTAEVSPTPACKPADAKVKVTQVKACGAR